MRGKNSIQLIRGLISSGNDSVLGLGVGVRGMETQWLEGSLRGGGKPCVWMVGLERL